jgi:hypothetical protein
MGILAPLGVYCSSGSCLGIGKGYSVANERTVADVLQDAHDAYLLVQRAYRDYMQIQGRERSLGLRNLVVWGRVVTNTLQKLKSATADRAAVAAWWKPYSDELSDDPEFKYLYDLRNQIDHEGAIGQLSHVMEIGRLSLNPAEIAKTRPPIQGNASFFVGDQWGGSGWRITQGDGTVVTFYMSLPKEWAEDVTTTLHFTEPTTSQGIQPPATSIEAILTRYVAYLGKLMDDAAQRFVK